MDIRTLAFVATLSAIMQAALLLVLWRAVPRSAGTPVWAAGGALLAFGFILLALRHLLPDILSIVVANVAIAAAHALYLVGIEHYCRRRRSWLFIAGVLVATLVLFVVFGLVIPDTAVRIETISLALALLSVLAAWRLWHRPAGFRSPVDQLVAGMLAAHAAFHLFRAVYTFAVEKGIGDFMAASTVHAIAFIDIIVFSFASGIGFAVLTVSALNRSLEKELADNNRLFSVLAHDLRAPFGALVNLTDLIQISFARGRRDQVEELAAQLSVNAKQVLALLDDLLTWARAEFKGEKPCSASLDLAGVIEAAVAPQSAIALEKGIAIRTDLAATRAAGVRAHAETVLRNLVSNALKFSRPGSEIVIRTRRQDGRVIVSVVDQGIGLPAGAEGDGVDIRDFPSRSGTAGEQGMGVGLTLCADLCRSAGQDIWLAGNPGGGTVASFTLSAESRSDCGDDRADAGQAEPAEKRSVASPQPFFMSAS